MEILGERNQAKQAHTRPACVAHVWLSEEVEEPGVAEGGREVAAVLPALPGGMPLYIISLKAIYSPLSGLVRAIPREGGSFMPGSDSSLGKTQTHHNPPRLTTVTRPTYVLNSVSYNASETWQ